ncbi:hypothetical protein SK128_007760 [Halocaridina rubra]|uniref:G-protein coupled receptors family 2 profile 2 domain-containing protein n=1 Tax=Halocaridina rubra TaxID=373956 RepID=A0AAN8XN97_HALRR
MSLWPYFLLVMVSSNCAIAQSPNDESDQSNSSYSMTGCCPPGHGILPTHTCVPFDSSQQLITFKDSNDSAWDMACDEGQVLHQVNLTDIATHVMDNEVLLAWRSPQTFSWILLETYCVAPSAISDPENEVQYVVAFCYNDPMIQWQRDEMACQNATCVRKCCPSGQIFNTSSCQTPIDGSAWQPHFQFKDDDVEQEPSDMMIVYGIPQCQQSFLGDDYSLLMSGYLKLSDFPEEITSNSYCLDMFTTDTGETVERSVICLSEDDGFCWWRHFIVDTLFMSISCVFLGITWLIYISVKELRGSTNGRSMISFLTALFAAFVTILVNRHHRESFSAFQCSLTGVLSHFSILATFFWLNVLCYHIWNCLRSARNSKESFPFVAYCLYGWGCPLVVSLVGVVLDALKADALRPDFVLPRCWFGDRTTKWVYQYGFMLVLLLVNLAFFLSSALMLTKRLRQTQDIKHHSESLWLYLKLFIVMGITWVMELITWLLEENSCTTWVTILDGITALHGVYIFLVTVCRRDLRIFTKCCGKTQYDVDGNTVTCTRDNFVELLDREKI